MGIDAKNIIIIIVIIKKEVEWLQWASSSMFTPIIPLTYSADAPTLVSLRMRTIFIPSYSSCMTLKYKGFSLVWTCTSCMHAIYIPLVLFIVFSL